METSRSTALVLRAATFARRPRGYGRAAAPAAAHRAGGEAVAPRSVAAQAALWRVARQVAVPGGRSPQAPPLPRTVQRALIAYQSGEFDAQRDFLHQVLGVDVLA